MASKKRKLKEILKKYVLIPSAIGLSFFSTGSKINYDYLSQYINPEPIKQVQQINDQDKKGKQHINTFKGAMEYLMSLFPAAHKPYKTYDDFKRYDELLKLKLIKPSPVVQHYFPDSNSLKKGIIDNSYSRTLEDIVHKETQKLKILTWNIEYGQNYSTILNELKKYKDYDVILLQEVDIGTSRVDYQDMARKLAKDLGMNYYYVPEFYEIGLKGVTGNMILTKHKILDYGNVNHTNYFNWPLSPWEKRIGGRITSWVVIEVNGKKYLVYDVHLEDKTNKYDRYDQLSEVINDIIKHSRYLKDLSGVILGGDFNTRKLDEPSVRFFGKNWIKTPNVSTSEYKFFKFPLDRIAAYLKGKNEKNVKYNYNIIESKASDHKGLSLEIEYMLFMALELGIITFAFIKVLGL